MTDLEFINWGINYLKNRGVSFTKTGYPIIRHEWLANTRPSFMIPFNKRQYSHSLPETAIVFFCSDYHLYPRLKTILKDIEKLKPFHSVVALDISISRYMPIQVQKFNLLINFIYSAILGVNGIKIIPSLRCGEEITIPILLCYEKPYFWAIGSIGCQRNARDPYAESLFASKTCVLNVDLILSYGKLNKRNKRLLNRLNITFQEYEDFRTSSYRKES